jgi:hypothetical protein
LTATGNPRAIFRRAVKRGNLLVAETTAREMGHVTLVEGLELTALIALRDSRRHGRAGARWTRRFLEERPDAGLDDLAFVVGCLSALGGIRHDTALRALRDMAEAASGTTARRDVA